MKHLNKNGAQMKAQLITLVTLLIWVVAVSYAQPMHIPDPNLRDAIRDALDGAPLTEDKMRRLTSLGAPARDIYSLSGLESAPNLKSLTLWANPGLNDLTPLTTLTQLEYLDVTNCAVVNITPLASMKSLKTLRASGNLIVDITPLKNLTQLAELYLDRNRITDIAALAQLQNLDILAIENNLIADHSSLNSLALSYFTYDQVCDSPALPLRPRMKNRTYPSIFARWSGPTWPPVSNQPELSGEANVALHDLRFSVTVFGLLLFDGPHGFELRGNINAATNTRDRILSLNPNIITLYTLQFSGAPLSTFPPDSPYWIRTETGDIFIPVGLEDGQPSTHGFLDITHPDVQDRIVEQAVAVSRCGLYDGIFFDYWSDIYPSFGGWDGTRWRYFLSLEEELNAKELILQRIRNQTRPDFLIMGNTNDTILPRTFPYINGAFMETTAPGANTKIHLETAFTRIENSLSWLDANLREPRINGLEGWAIPGEPPDSPNNLKWMRAITTLSLTHSDGYVVYTIPGTWKHYWYDFWDADLGQPVGEKGQLYQETDGLYIREFTNGWAVYNHSGAEQTVTLPELASGVAGGLEDTEHTLPNLDGEMYLRATPPNPADVNGDGVVNILDLTLVAQGFGTDSLEGDVNGDGVVNVFDLVQVAGALGGGGAAPSAYSLDPSIISAADVARWLAGAQGLGVGDTNFQRGIRFLEQLLAALTPKETTLLPNYPNPFNPETWIPYHLAREAEVAITIYDTKGTLVRRLALGNQEAGYYAGRGKAAYWDGRNERGEAVASGIYIYQFRAGDYAAARRMVIVK